MHRRTAIGAVASVGLAALAGSNAITGDERTTDDDGGRSNDVRSESDAEAYPAAGASANEPDVTFALGPYRLSACGATCREVTATLANAGDADATDVRVTVTLAAGDERLWETEESIGTLEAGGSVTQTERVDLGLGAALAVRSNDGRVTVTTLVESAQRTDEIVREMEIDT